MAKAPAPPTTETDAAAQAAAALQAQLAALRAELTATTSAAGQAAVAERNALRQQLAAANRANTPLPAPKPLAPLKQTLVDGGALAALRTQGAAAKSTAKAVGEIGGGRAKPLEMVEAGSKSLKLLAKDLGISKAQLRAPLTAGGIELTKLAMGVRGMAQLAAIEQRASFQLRQLFKGIDPMPVVRAADRFFQVFNKTSVTGQALEGIFGRAFGFIFGQIERLAPYAHTAFQGMVLAALTVEDKFGEAAEALKPLTDAIEEIIGPTDDMRAAAYLGAAALTAVAIAAAPAAFAVGSVAIAFKAVTAAIEQATKLYREWDSIALKKASYGIGDAGEKMNQGSAYRSDADLRLSQKDYEAKFGTGNAAPPSLGRGGELLDPGAKTGGQAAAAEATGKAYSDGLAKGVLAGADGVRSAAATVAAAIDSTVRTKTETHSPSRVAARTGAEQPAGMAQGIRAGTPDVAAAARDMGGAANVGGKGGGSGAAQNAATAGSVSIQITNHWPAGVAADGALEARFDDMSRKLVRDIAITLGRPVNP